MTPQQYNRINELVSEYSEVNALLEKAEADIKVRQLKAADSLLPEHAELKVRLTNITDQLRKLSDEFYDSLFPDEEKRNHKTPFGALQYRKSSYLDFDDEEKTLLKIEVACTKELARVANTDEPPRFVESQLIRTKKQVNLEGMNGMDDATLALFGVTRKRDDKFKVDPFDMKTDKPAKAAREKLAA